jgi:putative endonuclease
VERPPHFCFCLFHAVVCVNDAIIPLPEQAYVYILASSFQRLYIGITTDFETRMRQHKSHEHPTGFTARYNIDKLVYYECYALVIQAVAREKQLKRWSRIKKIGLIVALNPTWQRP